MQMFLLLVMLPLGRKGGSKIDFLINSPIKDTGHSALFKNEPMLGMRLRSQAHALHV